MTQEKDTQTASAIEKFEHFLKQQEEGHHTVMPEFNQDEIAVLKRVVLAVKGLDALGSFAGVVKTTLIWLGVILGTFIAIKNGAVEFVLDVSSGGR